MRPGEASETARRVAAQRLTFARVDPPYGDPDADDRLAGDVAGGLDGSQGLLRAYLEARTAFFDRVVVDALARGVGQVAVGAAGYDGRSLRYAKPGVRWFEFDHPATQADKLRRLDALAIDRGHVTFVATDFNDGDTAARLRQGGLDPALATLFLLEGVAVYLELATLETVLGQLRELVVPDSQPASPDSQPASPDSQPALAGSRLAVSLSADQGDEDRRARFRAAVSAMGEPTRTHLDAEGTAALLLKTGWRPRPTSERSRQAGLMVLEPA
jgi:methyltransferase (TIGR00027 family)